MLCGVLILNELISDACQVRLVCLKNSACSQTVSKVIGLIIIETWTYIAY